MAKNIMREEIANSFIKALKEDKIPWEKGWISRECPVNAVNGSTYRGINKMWLSCVAGEKGYTDPRWCTFKQASDQGWKIRKGEKGTHVEFWSLYDTQTKKKLSSQEAKKLSETLDPEVYLDRVKPIASNYVVFNAGQIEGIPERTVVREAFQAEELMSKRDVLLKNMGVAFHEGGDAAAYYPKEDLITMPFAEDFKDAYSYMAGLLHEAGHATGHKTRLDRDVENRFGTPEYAREELRAEISSAFTAQALMLDNDTSTGEFLENHKAYVQGWITVLENNPNELFAAIRDAEKISDYLIEKGEFDLDSKIQERIPENRSLEERFRQEFPSIPKVDLSVYAGDDRTFLLSDAQAKLGIKLGVPIGVSSSYEEHHGIFEDMYYFEQATSIEGLEHLLSEKTNNNFAVLHPHLPKEMKMKLKEFLSELETEKGEYDLDLMAQERGQDQNVSNQTVNETIEQYQKPTPEADMSLQTSLTSEGIKILGLYEFHGEEEYVHFRQNGREYLTNGTTVLEDIDMLGDIQGIQNFERVAAIDTDSLMENLSVHNPQIVFSDQQLELMKNFIPMEEITIGVSEIEILALYKQDISKQYVQYLQDGELRLTDGEKIWTDHYSIRELLSQDGMEKADLLDRRELLKKLDRFLPDCGVQEQLRKWPQLADDTLYNLSLYDKQEAASIRLAIKGRELHIELWKNNIGYKVGLAASEYVDQGMSIQEVIANHLNDIDKQCLIGDPKYTKNVLSSVYAHNTEEYRNLNGIDTREDLNLQETSFEAGKSDIFSSIGKGNPDMQQNIFGHSGHGAVKGQQKIKPQPQLGR